MFVDLEIKCINKTPRNIPHGRIQNVGGSENGQRWRLTEEEAIAGIEAKKWLFYVCIGGESVRVIVAQHDGRKYLKTLNDGLQPNTLLRLPECARVSLAIT